MSPWSCTFCRLGEPQACGAVGSGQVAPRHPEEHLLSLLPPGPDEVRGLPPRGTQPSTSLTPQSPRRPSLEKDFGPAKADCGYRAPLVPRLARPRQSLAQPTRRKRRRLLDCAPMRAHSLSLAERAGERVVDCEHTKQPSP